MKKIFLLIVLFTTFLYSHTPSGNRKVWVDTLKISSGGSFVDTMEIISDSSSSSGPNTAVIAGQSRAVSDHTTNNNIVNVADFGATGDSSTVGTLAFQNAFAALSDGANYVYIQGGTYNLAGMSGAIHVDKPVTIVGVGNPVLKGTLTDSLFNFNKSVTIEGVSFEDWKVPVTFYYLGDPNAGEDKSEAIFEQCKFFSAELGLNGNHPYGNTDSTNTLDRVLVTECVFDSVRAPIFIQEINIKSIEIMNNDFFDIINYSHHTEYVLNDDLVCILIGSSESDYQVNYPIVRIEGNNFRNIQTWYTYSIYCIVVYKANITHINNNVFQDVSNHVSSGNYSSTAMYLRKTALEQVTGNTFRNCGYSTIDLKKGSVGWNVDSISTIITDNIFYVDSAYIDTLTVYGVTPRAINIGEDSPQGNIQIKDNTFTNFTKTIYSKGTERQDITIEHNTFLNCKLPIEFDSGGDHILIKENKMIGVENYGINFSAGQPNHHIKYLRILNNEIFIKDSTTGASTGAINSNTIPKHTTIAGNWMGMSVDGAVPADYSSISVPRIVKIDNAVGYYDSTDVITIDFKDNILYGSDYDGNPMIEFNSKATTINYTGNHSYIGKQVLTVSDTVQNLIIKNNLNEHIRQGSLTSQDPFDISIQPTVRLAIQDNIGSRTETEQYGQAYITNASYVDVDHLLLNLDDHAIDNSTTGKYFMITPMDSIGNRNMYYSIIDWNTFRVSIDSTVGVGDTLRFSWKGWTLLNEIY